MTRAYRLSIPAERDLDEIWDFTEARFGERQASKYLRQLKRRIESLAKRPALGQRRDDLAPGLLSHHEGRHFILYKMGTA